MDKHNSKTDLSELDAFRKKLIFRAWHRGTRELDLIIGSFADAHLYSFDEKQLHTFEDILSISDPDIYNWISGREELPANVDSDVMQLLIAHKIEGRGRS